MQRHKWRLILLALALANAVWFFVVGDGDCPVSADKFAWVSGC